MSLPSQPASSLTFEESIVQLEKIVRQLDDGKTSLEVALAEYEKGIQLLQHCSALLDSAQRRIEILRGTAEDGSPVLAPLSEQSLRTNETAGGRY